MRRLASISLLALAIAVIPVACDDDDDPSGPAAEEFRATLNGPNERPTPRETPATGTATFTFRRDTLRWVITMNSITNVIMAHIHIGGADVAGGILVDLVQSGPSNTRIEGLLAREDYTIPNGQTTTFDQLLQLMRTGGVYVNVHTNNTANDPTNNTGPGDFPAGEIRGQIVSAP